MNEILPTDTVSVHRFRDYVAVSFPGVGQTIYLPAITASELGDMLMDFAHDVDSCRFTDSKLRTQTIKPQP